MVTGNQEQQEWDVKRHVKDPDSKVFDSDPVRGRKVCIVALRLGRTLKFRSVQSGFGRMYTTW